MNSPLFNKHIKAIFLLFTFVTSYSQKILLGVVTDSLNNPLQNANIIAKPSKINAQLKFSSTNIVGQYKLLLDSGEYYEITASYIGYLENKFVADSSKNTIKHDFILKNTGQKIKEIFIKYDFKAVVVKKDTMIFKVNAFANGNERKLKEILEKLPGVEVDKNGSVTVQGKKVTKMLVEGKPFFGGGSKLAVENIPADVLDKIEVIDHFNQVGFMKKVSDSEDLAMNITLKSNKKKFAFGDVELGLDVAGRSGYYKSHAGIFYYSPKTNINYIGDSNNIGKSTFTFDDLLRFEGGTSSYNTARKPLTNLFSLIDDNTDVVINRSQFSAINVDHSITSKFSIAGFAIFSKIFNESDIINKNLFLQNSVVNFENKFENNNKNTILGIANIKLDYSPTVNEKWYYNAQYQFNTNKNNTIINSVTNSGSNFFNAQRQVDNQSIKQYVEWLKKINDNNIMTLVINSIFEKSTPENIWLTNQPFLATLIPLQATNVYNIAQIKKVINTSFDVLFKYYLSVNNHNQLYGIIGNNHANSQFISSEKQILSTEMINDFASAGFGNNINFVLNDFYGGLEYRIKIGKWTSKQGLYLHRYHLSTSQNLQAETVKKLLFEPQLTTEYEFSQSEALHFIYKLANSFPEINQLANKFTLQNYNLLFKGNALLQNEQFHSANLRYTRMNMLRGAIISANISYVNKIQTIRNQIELNGINQFTSPILTNNPETNWRMFGSVSKKIYRFNLKVNTNFNWQSYLLNLNNISSFTERNSQKMGLLFKTVFNKWPEVNIGYSKGYNQLKGITQTNYQSEEFNVDFELKFLKSWIFYVQYESLKNTNNNSQSNFFEVSNASLRYQKKYSPFGFELLVNNLSDNKVVNNYLFSDYSISEQSSYVLPRIILLSVNYKL